MRTMQDWTPAEHAIYNAMLEVEKMEANVLLTDAVNLISQAKAKVDEWAKSKEKK